MPNYLFGHMWSLNSHNSSDIFEDHKSEGHILPEKASVFIENDFIRLFRVSRYHWELDSRDALVCCFVSVEDAFE